TRGGRFAAPVRGIRQDGALSGLRAPRPGAVAGRLICRRRSRPGSERFASHQLSVRSPPALPRARAGPSSKPLRHGRGIPPRSPGVVWHRGGSVTWLSNDLVDRLRDVATRPELATNRYVILRPIGRGGMGGVYAARDEQP